MQLRNLLPCVLATLAGACTWFEIPTKHHGSVMGRSMELADLLPEGKMDWRVVVHSRSVAAHRPIGYVSIDALNLHRLGPNLSTLITEGMNEKGLTVSANTMHMSVYQNGDASEKPKVLWWDVVSYCLSQFGTVREAIDGLKKVDIIGGPKALCKLGACFHWAIADAAGNSAIVEYIKGEMTVHEGRSQHVGVMTNDPQLDWHHTNLDMYVHVSPLWPDTNHEISQVLETGPVPMITGNGFNLKGLPGDSSPSSRFVRMFYLREYALRNDKKGLKDKSSAITLATGLLNNVYIIKGTVGKKRGEPMGYEYTPWAVLKLPHEGLFMYRTSSDMTWKQISMAQVNFLSEETQQIKLDVNEVEVQDVTKLLSSKSDMLLDAGIQTSMV